jgi:tetratricopeptide (TPR) repeat protein
MSIAHIRHMGSVRAQSRRGRQRLAALGFCGWCGLAFGADPAGTPQSRAAVAACNAGATQPPAARAAHFDRALAAAEAAVAADDRDALAHFAVFCALGERMHLDGASLAALAGVRRLRREIDRTLELAPDFADALAGKGALLTDLPRLLGGDVAAGEQLLRRALAIDPDFLGPRLRLAESLLDQGRRDEARREAEAALAVAERKRSSEDITAARQLLARVGPGAPR